MKVSDAVRRSRGLREREEWEGHDPSQEEKRAT
jgi:hypothetical protein